MPISKQEKHCIIKGCEFLSKAIGGDWKVDIYLDELYPEKPTPEVTVTNGSITAAIEVKRMKGNSTEQAYLESLRSNQRYLTPSCGGYYWISPPVDFHLPMEDLLRKQVKKEIERVAPSLGPGDTGVLLIPRSGHITFISEQNPPMIICSHGGYADLFAPIIQQLSGRFMLIDKGYKHSFFTDEGKEAFYCSVLAACQRGLEGDTSTFSWYEEWQINKIKQKEGEKRDGVWIIAATEAFPVIPAIEENLQTIIDNAVRKFSRRWAQFHILVIEDEISAFLEETREIIGTLQPDMLSNIDYVLLVTGDKIIQCYPQSD